MPDVPYADSNGTLSVTVELEHAADVFLVDSVNYNRFKSGKDFKYFGGHYKKSPVTITVSGSGRWYLIVIGNGKYQYRFY